MMKKIQEKLIKKFKNLYFFIISLFTIYITSISLTYADGGFLGNFKGSGARTLKAIRTGDIHTENIPIIIKGAIDFFMSLAGLIAIIFVIIGAYKILFGSIEADTTKGKNTIFMALGGFALAALSWFIIKLIIDNLS